MRSGDPVPAITENDAAGEVAELYADIRETLGIPLVNLIWRNLATMPGALAWAWSSVRPLYESGLIQNEALALIEAQQLPVVPRLPAASLRAIGVDAEAERVIRGILDSYDRSNPLNLIALSTLLAMLRNEIADEPVPPAMAKAQQAFDVTLPALVNLHETSDETAELVRAVNRLGARGRDHILVSMPRHLAHWPGFLTLYWTLIAPLDVSGELHRCIDSIFTNGQAAGARLAGAIGQTQQPPEASRAQIETTLDDFCRHAISRMIPVVGLLKKAMPAS
jgi:hypothetical protein